MQRNLISIEEIKLLAQIKEIGEKNRTDKNYSTLPLRNT